MPSGDEFETGSVSSFPPAWDDLESFMSSLEQLSYQDVASTGFFSRMVEGLRPFGFRSVEVFRIRGGERMRLAPPADAPSIPQPASTDRRDIETGTPAIAPPLRPGESRFERETQNRGSSRFSVQHCLALDEILQLDAVTEPGTDHPTQQIQELLGTCMLLSGHFLIRHDVSDLKKRLTVRRIVEEMSSQLAQQADLPEPAGEICRVIQRTLEVDRVSLFSIASRSAKLLGNSATSNPSGKGGAVRLLERITSQIAHQQSELEIRMGGESSPLASSLRQQVDQYIEETGVRALLWIPVWSSVRSTEQNSTSTLLGMLLLEHFSSEWPNSQQQPVYELAKPQAVQSARRVLLDFRRGWWGSLRRVAARRGAWVIGGLALTTLITILLFTIPATLEIPVDGVLKPSRRAAVFAPLQGVVDQVAVQHEQSVAVGTPLFKLRAPDLEIEERRISGEMATLRTRLDSLKSARIRNRVSGTRAESDADLSAEESDLETQLRGLHAQLELVHQQMDFLIVKSPLHGQVDRWDLVQSLSGRPVSHGQYLCDVLDVTGDWEIELSVPDDVIGYVLQAQQQAPCPVSYFFRTNSGRKFSSRLTTLSNTAQLDREGRSIVHATMPAVTDADVPFRVGAGVLARVDCGKRSLGFVYFREVIEFLRRTFWLP